MSDDADAWLAELIASDGDEELEGLGDLHVALAETFGVSEAEARKEIARVQTGGRGVSPALAPALARARRSQGEVDAGRTGRELEDAVRTERIPGIAWGPAVRRAREADERRKGK